MCELVENAGGTVVGVAFLIELGLPPRPLPLAPYEVISLVTYATPDD
jgi:adenine/guanine phosphoribosyltransferase-like PRPP-binding protein